MENPRAGQGGPFLIVTLSGARKGLPTAVLISETSREVQGKGCGGLRNRVSRDRFVEE